jgi:hypothetical protein
MMLPIRNKKPPLSDIGLPFSQTLLYKFLLLFRFWICATFQIIISINCNIRRSKVVMVHDSINNNNNNNNNKNNGFYLKISKYGTFTLLYFNMISESRKCGAKKKHSLLSYSNLNSWPLLSNISVTTFQWQQIRARKWSNFWRMDTQQWRNHGHGVFSDIRSKAIYREPKRLEIASNPVPGGSILATLFLGYINTGTWPSRLGESGIWERKIWSWVLRDWDLTMTALARPSSNCKRQTHPLVREDVT